MHINGEDFGRDAEISETDDGGRGERKIDALMPLLKTNIGRCGVRKT